MNAPTIIIAIVIFAIVSAIVVNGIRKRKSGKSSCGCGCGCPGCSGACGSMK